MKKIFLIRANKNPYGGAENYLLRLSSQLTKIGFKHQIIYSNLPKFLPSWIRVLLFNLKLSLLKSKKFYFSLERISCSDIYRAGDGVHKEFLRIEKKSKFNPLHPIYLFLEKKCFENSKKIIANSYMVKREIIKNYGIDEKKIIVIYNGFNPKKLDYEDSYKKISKEFDINKNEKFFLFVGSGFKRKGVENFLEIISKLRDRKIKAFVVGKESNLKYYKKISHDLMINDIVYFVGARLDVNDFYNISDIFILPSTYEPFGNAVLEAMSYGNAVFTTKQTGASELINSKFIMAEPDDQNILDKIKILLDDQNKLVKVKMNNIERSTKFTVEKNVSETLRVINEIIT
jgi:UDP-glucose:(heptosyl)LPS alpha-1,3-glucosyltransferase